MDFNCSMLWLFMAQMQRSALASIDEFTLMESATREICWSLRERYRKGR